MAVVKKQNFSVPNISRGKPFVSHFRRIPSVFNRYPDEVIICLWAHLLVALKTALIKHGLNRKTNLKLNIF